jgi:hypothetical protein
MIHDHGHCHLVKNAEHIKRKPVNRHPGSHELSMYFMASAITFVLGALWLARADLDGLRSQRSLRQSRHLLFFDRRMTMARYDFINSTRPEFVRRSAWDNARQSGSCCVTTLRTSSQKSSRLV